MHFSLNEAWSISVTAIFVQNAIFVAMLCSSAFFKSLKNPFTALAYTGCVTFFSTLASALGWLMDRLVLQRFGLAFLEPFTYVLIVACMEVALEFLLLRYFPKFRKKLGGLLPATAFSCAVLGLVLLNVGTVSAGFFGTVFYGFCAGIGFALAFCMALCALEKQKFSTPPAPFAGLPISFVTAGLISLAFMGFSNIQIPY